jgi:hypothetical protein
MICDRRGNPVGCSSAGTEQCDFECPHRDELYRVLAKKAAKRGPNAEVTALSERTKERSD